MPLQIKPYGIFLDYLPQSMIQLRRRQFNIGVLEAVRLRGAAMLVPTLIPDPDNTGVGNVQSPRGFSVWACFFKGEY